MKRIPEELLEFIKSKKTGSSSCKDCSFSCCFQSGFALQENVKQIYELYKDEKLIRADYKFKENLTYEKFVEVYFDVIQFQGLDLILYFPRHLAYDNVALIINPSPNINYWDHRKNILIDPINECKGCIFLESSMSLSDQSSKKCILHNQKLEDFMYAKPIDCVRLTCDQNQRT